MMMERITSNVTQPAVLAALAEYDKLGQKQFLEKYGYGRARKYQLWHDGKPYDSKAIIGAAFGYLPGSPPPLRRDEFSGGMVYVVPVLKALGFSFDSPARTAARNPPWSRDELILALDLYYRHDGRDPGDTHPDVIALSARLREMADGARLITFRNANDVVMKFMNFRSLDPNFTNDGGKGLNSANKLDRVVWDEFSGNRQALSIAAEAIWQGVIVDLDEDILDKIESYEAKEGRVSYRLHKHLELDRKIVALRKTGALEKHGKLECEACGFNFLATYGSRGAGYIEAHHTNPIHAITEGETTKASDLALLCANCHRMIHASKPWLTLAQLRELITKPS
ncbi:HNH endonuclease [Acetobacter syzygii]|uniref:HNH endonuclease n=1 Tax=Acetobacter syzygii TaxID=146476 RepID=UPI0039EC5CFC